MKAAEEAVYQLVKGAPTGYNRDLQEAKEPFMEGIATTRASLQIMAAMMQQTKVNKKALLDGSHQAFATDRALEYVSEGMPFRDAYHKVKEELASLDALDPQEAIDKKDHFGAPSGIEELYAKRLRELKLATQKKQKL